MTERYMYQYNTIKDNKIKVNIFCILKMVILLISLFYFRRKIHNVDKLFDSWVIYRLSILVSALRWQCIVIYSAYVRISLICGRLRIQRWQNADKYAFHGGTCFTYINNGYQFFRWSRFETETCMFAFSRWHSRIVHDLIEC